MKKILSATLFLFLVTLHTNTAVAATFTVNDTSDVVDSIPGDGYCDTDSIPDNSPCTLRAALMEANNDTAQDEIIIPAGTYTLSIQNSDNPDEQSTGDLDILAPVILTGAGVGISIIDANGLDRVLEISRDAVNSKLQGLTFTGGYLAGDYGGGIYSAPDNLTIENCEITGNTIEQDIIAIMGGGLYLTGNTATLKNVSITHNKLLSGNGHGYGGGLCTKSVGQSSYANMDISDNVIKLSDGEGKGGGWYGDSEYSNSYTNIRLDNNSITAGEASGGAIYFAVSNGNTFKNIEMNGQTITAFVTNTYSGAGFGGAIYALSTNDTWENIRISNTTITSNDEFKGYGFYLNEAKNSSVNFLEITDSTVTVSSTPNRNNINGALSITNGENLSISNTRISRNTLEGDSMVAGIDLQYTEGTLFDSIEISENINNYAANNESYAQSGYMIWQYDSNGIVWKNIFILNNNKNDSDPVRDTGHLMEIRSSSSTTLNNIFVGYNNLAVPNDNTAIDVTYSENISMDFLDIYANNSRGIFLSNLKNSYLRNSTIKKNSSYSAYKNRDDFDGGGLEIRDADFFKITNVDISQNTLQTPFYSARGGGLYSMDSSLEINRSRISENKVITPCSVTGGGVALNANKLSAHNSEHYVIIKNSAINGNQVIISNEDNSTCVTSGSGTGIGISSNLITTIEQTTIAKNELRIDPSRKDGDGLGGGIYFYGDCTSTDLRGTCTKGTPAKLEIFSSTIAGNILRYYDTERSINRPIGNAGGLFSYTSDQTPDTKLNNTLLADNKAKISPDCYGDWVSAGYNLISNMTDCNAQLTMHHDYAGSRHLDAKLMPLANNGGSTETMALESGSIAIDNGDPACKDHLGNPFTEDQRGLGFNRRKDGDTDGTFQCDIGAFEVQRAGELRVKGIF